MFYLKRLIPYYFKTYCMQVFNFFTVGHYLSSFDYIPRTKWLLYDWQILKANWDWIVWMLFLSCFAGPLLVMFLLLCLPLRHWVLLLWPLCLLLYVRVSTWSCLSFTYFNFCNHNNCKNFAWRGLIFIYNVSFWRNMVGLR
jgi:hypothetical protein